MDAPSTSISISSTSVHQPIPSQPKHSKTSIALDVSELLLTTLHAAARYSHIPYLQDAAKCALEILVVTKNVRAHKEAFRRLASDACELVYAVVLTVDKNAPTTEQLLNNLRELLRKLMDIERFARKESDRGLVIRTIRHKSDLDTINEYREKLKQSLDLFGLQSNISIRQNLARLQEILEKQESSKLDLEKAEKETAEAERRRKEELIRQLEELERKEREDQERKRKEEKIRLERYRLEQELQRKEREEEERKKNEEKILLEKYRLEQELERRRKERLESEKLAAEVTEKQRLEVELERLRREEEQQKKTLESQVELDKLKRQMQRAEEERVELQRLQWVAEKEERERIETSGMEEELRAMREAYARTQDDLAALRARPTPSPIPSPFSSPGSPYTQSPAGYFPPTGFISSFGSLSMNNTNGPNNLFSGSVLNHNSGNTNTIITTNSNNDSSVRMYGGAKSRRRS